MIIEIMINLAGIFHKILVPIDGSKPADNALGKALQLAKIHGSVVEVLHVMSVTEDLPTEPERSEKTDTPSEWVEEYLNQIRKKDEKMLSEAMDEAKKMGLEGKVTSKLLIGKPEDAILREATLGAFDLIVIGDRGISGLKELVLGSVSHQVVDQSKIPVLVVK
jgi:nucleotide-binding universal stress UspA family protein